ncbi:MAG: hypothetical protein C0506_10745 [Anaerolinea sp.]|nr:hypothetical protein [Anaerolinea sp.]
MTLAEGLTLPAPLSGLVLAVLVELGTDVQEGDELVIFESMKMEIPLEAPRHGRVTRILVGEGDKVAEGDAVLVIA